MSRYLNSFFLTLFLYSFMGATTYYILENVILTNDNKEDNITKISLSSVVLEQVPQVQPSPPEPEPEPEPIVEPEPIIEPIIEKPVPIKKVEKPKPKPKPKPIQKPVEKVVETVQEVYTPTVSNVKPVENMAPIKPTFSKAHIENLEAKYLAKVHATVEKNKVYPRAAKRLNQTGKVHVNFDILKNGKIQNVKIVQKSKFEKLDSASIELLLNIGHFEVIPDEINKSVWNITIPISYQIN